MKREHLGLGILLAALLAGGIWYLRRGNGDAAPASDVADDSADRGPAVPPPQRDRDSSEASAGAAANQTTSLVMDVDPVGKLLLEGQVVDDHGDPVEGATVYLDARPPRTATSNADGSFSFDKLVTRRYGVSARSGAMAGGPVVYHLTADSDPVLIRLQAAASMVVTVVDRDSGAPISGAVVGMMGMAETSATTDGDGVARVEGVRAGWEQLVVKASGYATARMPLRVPDAAVELARRIELERGVKLAGTVVDDDSGKPISGARVVARSSARPFEPVDIFADGVTTDTKGRFAIEGLAVGTYRFLAIHERYAPGTSDNVALSESVQPAVEIRLAEGAVVSGTVVGAGGSPTPWAQVNVRTNPRARGQWGGGVVRAVIAGEDGTFEIEGLPREKMKLLASTAEASSEIVDVALDAQRKVEGVTLELTITGTIAGVVVDESGDPVAEVQVSANTDFWGGADLAEAQIRGGGIATTDGGGNFAIRGLADGAYLVRATRSVSLPSQLLGKPIKARTGDTELRVVLARDGGVKGKVVAADGGAPELAVATIGWAGAVPVSRDGFQIDGLPPGTYDLSIRGPFPVRVVRGVTIESGKTTDVGTIKIDPGRAITGRVIDAAGKPVEGARVALGQQLVGDGANLITQLDDASASAMGLRRGVTAANGEFRIAGVGTDEAAIAAEHTDLGRSAPATIPANGPDQRIELRLVPFGSLAGTVTLSGKPAPDVAVLVSSPTTARQLIAATSGADGGFVVDRVPAGNYKVIAMIGGGATAQMATVQATVEAGKRAVVELAITVGEIDLSVPVAGVDGAQVDAAQVFLFGNPEVSPKTGGEVQQVFIADESGTAKMAFANAGQPAVFEKIEPGDYALCVIPITGDMNDPTFAQRLQQHAMNIKVYCDPIDVPASPSKQSHPVAVPAMDPLPE